MQLLKVDHLKSVAGKQSVPSLTFKINGVINITPALVKEVKPEALESDGEYFLHIYTCENPVTNPEIGIIIDQNPTEGLKIRFDKAANEGGRAKSNIVISAKPIIQKMTKDFDWPLAAEKNASVKYTYKDQSQLSDGTPIFILI